MVGDKCACLRLACSVIVTISNLARCSVLWHGYHKLFVQLATHYCPFLVLAFLHAVELGILYDIFQCSDYCSLFYLPRKLISKFESQTPRHLDLTPVVDGRTGTSIL